MNYVIGGGVEGTDYSFVPSSLGKRCFGFDATIVIIAVGLWFYVGYNRNVHICSSLCDTVHYIVSVCTYVNGKRPLAERKVNRLLEEIPFFFKKKSQQMASRRLDTVIYTPIY